MRTLSAWCRAAAVLGLALDLPVLARLARMVTQTPTEHEVDLTDAPATVFTCARGGPHPAIVFLNGATPQGRRHPAVRRLAAALARVGHRVLVPDVYGVDRGEISERSVAATVGVAGQVEGTIAFLGVSVGTTLGLLAAEDPLLAGRVSVVSGIAGYVDLPDLIRIATTERFESAPFLFECVDRSVRAAASGGAVDAVLANRDPARFAALYGKLSPDVQAAIERLSPAHGAARLRAPVYILAGRGDKYFSPEHLARLPQATIMTTGLLTHVNVRFSRRMLADLARLFTFTARTLRAAAAAR